MQVTKSEKHTKRLKATFDNGKRTIHFGSKNAQTWVDGASQQVKSAWLARHRVNENWNNPRSAGALARYILWGKNRSIAANVASFKRRFKL